MPVKDIRKQKGILRGAIPSLKLGRMVYWKSSLARDYSRLLEYDPLVFSYEEQPAIISYRWNGDLCSYTPDFLVQRYHQNPTVVACVWGSSLHDPIFLARWAATLHWCQKRHYTFSLVTEEILQKHEVLIHNLQQLAVHIHRTIEPQVVEYLLRTLIASSQPLSLSEIILQTPQVPAKVIPGAIWHLLAVGRLMTDLTQPLHVTKTPIWWKGTHHVANQPQSEDP